MDEPIRVETGMTYEDFKKFSWFNILKKGKGPRPSVIVMLACFALALAAFIMLAVDQGLAYFMETSGVYFVILACFIPFYFLLLALMFKLGYKRARNVLTSRQVYEFDATRMRIETSGEAMTGSSEFRYDTLHRAFETQGAFYLYVNSVQAFLVPKRDMGGDSAGRLAGLLNEKLGKKYIKCF